MFTGLIQAMGEIHALNMGKLSIRSQGFFVECKVGDSIAVNGICLTLTKVDPHHGEFDVSATTARHGNFTPGRLRPGSQVNLEKAMRLSDRLDGHLVTGHVDGRARLISIERKENSSLYEFQAPIELRRMIAAKGSVALDGISLTVAELRSSTFLVAVIPQTLHGTNLKHLRLGDEIHIEVDILARYVHHMLQSGGTP